MSEGMLTKQELIKQQIGNPFKIWDAIERGARDGYATLTQDELFLFKWYGLYEHRHEKGQFMIRLKLTNGCLTAQQLATIADIAEKQNRGFADVTTRQDIQLHWIAMADAPGIVKQLEAVSISTLGACGDVTRNVVGCPVAGVDQDELIDGRPLAQQISDYFLGKVEYANLPRKFKISVIGCRDQCPQPEIQCLSFVAMERTVSGQREVGFDLRAGGGLSTQPFLAQRLNAFVRQEQVLPVAIAVTELYRDSNEYRQKRHHARLKYVVHDMGVAAFRAEVERRLGFRLDDAPPYEAPLEQFRDHVGVHEQKQRGFYYVGIPIIVGRITSAQMHKVAELAERHSDPALSSEMGGAIRASVKQNLVLLNVPEAAVEKVLQGLTNVGLSVNAHPIRRGVVTCTGTEFCNLAITETKARAKQITEYLEKLVSLEEPLRIHITGCPNACAQYQIGHIGLMGSKTQLHGATVDAFDVFIGGQLGRDAGFVHPIVRKIPAEHVAERLKELLQGYLKARKPGERFNAFCRRVGDAKLVELLLGKDGRADQVVPPGTPLPKPISAPPSHV